MIFQYVPMYACLCIFVFFFKQKTAYEMRISDWSSDVCSSDLITLPLLSPTLLFASVVLTISAFQSFGQIDLLTQGGPLDSTRVIVYSIFSDARAGDPGLAAAQATLLFLILFVLTIVQLRVLERRTFYGGER